MKKLFTSIKYVMTVAALLLSANAMADEISWNGQTGWEGIGGQEIEYATADYSIFCAKNSGSTSPTVNASAGDLRVYAKGSLRILTEKTMTTIVFKISNQGKKRLTDITPSTGSVSIDATAWTVTWTGSASDVTFTVGDKATYGTEGDSKAGQFDIDSPIEVYADGGGTYVPAPVITPASGTFTEPQTVTITAESGLTIWVSKAIGETFKKYTAPFTVSEDATITAYAADAAGNKSTTVTVAYTFVSSDFTGDGTADNPYTVADVIALFTFDMLPSEKVYVKGKVSEIKSLDVSQWERAQYYISDDGSTTNQFYIYNGYYLGGEAFTANDQIKVGDEVVVYGSLVLYGSTKEMAANNYIYKLNGEGGTVVEPDRYETIASAIGGATDTHKEAYIKLDQVVVTYINGTSVYVIEKDTGRGFLFYGTNGLPEGLKVGDMMQGTVFGELYLYHGLAEMTPSATNTSITVVENETVEPQISELADLLVDPQYQSSLLVKLEGFLIDGTGLTDKQVTINQYGDEAILFDQFQVLTGMTFDPDNEYTATFITTIRDGVLQLYPVDKTEFEIDTPEPELPTYFSIAELNNAATADKVAVEFNFEKTQLTVTYINGRNTYVKDGRGNGFLLFGTAMEGVNVGDLIEGSIKGNLYLYHGLPELEITESEVTVVESGSVSYDAVALENIISDTYAQYLSLIVRIDEVYPTATALESRAVTFTADGIDITVYDQFNVITGIEFDTEKPYSITGVVSVRDGVIQFFPINRDEFVLPYEYEGEGSEENPYTIADVQHLWTPKEPSADVWVNGVIIGCVNGTFTEDAFSTTGLYPKEDGTTQEVKSNIVLAPVKSSSKARKANGYDITECIPVNLVANSEFREKLNVVDNPDVVGKEVSILASVQDYFSQAGLKEIKDVIIDGESLGIHGIQLDKQILTGDIYTIAGQKVNTITRGGLYIIGGKKVFVK